MIRPRHECRRATALVVSTCLALAACTIDKGATADNLIRDVEKTHAIKLSAAGKECLQKLIAHLSTDELNALNQAKASATLKARFFAGEVNCVPAIGLPATSNTVAGPSKTNPVGSTESPFTTLPATSVAATDASSSVGADASVTLAP
jgi:hypothetical protein